MSDVSREIAVRTNAAVTVVDAAGQSAPRNIDWRYLYRLIHRAADGLSDNPATEDFHRYIEYELRKSRFREAARLRPLGKDGPDFLIDSVAVAAVVGNAVRKQRLERYAAVEGIQVALGVRFDAGKRTVAFDRIWKNPTAAIATTASVPIVITPDPLTHTDYEAIKAALPNWRDMLLVKVLRTTGLRISETLKITTDRVKPVGPDVVIFIQRSKRPTKRLQDTWDRILMQPVIGKELASYIDGQGLPLGARIWPISRVQAWRIIFNAGQKAIGRGVHPHEFRGLYIRTAINFGYPLSAVAKMVGHTSSKTTEQWYYELTAEQRDEIQRRMPA